MLLLEFCFFVLLNLLLCQVCFDLVLVLKEHKSMHAMLWYLNYEFRSLKDNLEGPTSFKHIILLYLNYEFRSLKDNLEGPTSFKHIMILWCLKKFNFLRMCTHVLD